VLSGFSASFARGRITAVTGPNGCGKTTLAKLLTGMLAPSGGRVLVDGAAVRGMTLDEVGRRIGLVMQNPERQMFTTSVREELEFGLRHFGFPEGEVAARRDRFAEAFGIGHLMDRFPFELSGGEKQRVVLAAVLATGPDYLVLDEPTSGLDRGRRRALGTLLRRLADEDGVGVIVISHDAPFLAAYADEVVDMAPAAGGAAGRDDADPGPAAGPDDAVPGAAAETDRPSPLATQESLPLPRRSLRALDPRTKMLMMAVVSGFAVAATGLAFLASLLALSFAALAVGGADLPRALKRCRALFALIAALFVIQAVFAVRFDPDATPLLTVGGTVVLYKEGALLAAMLALRLLVVVASAQILLEGEMRDYLLGFTQMRVPYEIAFMVVVGLHFLPILREEAVSVYQGMQLRGVRFRKTGPLRRFKAFAGLCLPVFVGTLRRADETATAMELRAFRAHKTRTSMRRLTLRREDAVVMVLWCVAVVCLYIVL
jgi:energy-coupling factor transport system ATP-binding protein